MSESSEEYLNFKSTDFVDKLSLHVRTLFESGEHCDSVIFGDNDEKVRAHRLILDATIPNLKTSFQLQNGTDQDFGCNEASDEKSAMFVCRLPMKIQIITKVVKFCYSGEISIAHDELVPLLKFAIDYNVKELIDICSDRLKQTIDSDNFKQIIEQWKNADNVLELRMWRQIICPNFLKVSKYPTFGDITMDQFVNILRSPDLRNIREEEVFRAFLLWLEKPNNLNAHLDIGSMFTYIRFPLMNLKFFTENVQKLLEKFNRNDLSTEYYKWQLIQHRLIDLKTEECNERMSLRQDDLAVLTVKANNKLFMQIVPPQPGKPVTCREIVELEYNQYHSITNISDSELIISGGEDEHNKDISTVTGFNLKTMKKMEYPALQTPRSFHALIAINSDIYVAGGCSSAGTLNSVEKYSRIDKKWTFVKPMIWNRMEFFLLAVNGYIYALGGRDVDKEPMLNSAERYDPSLDDWTAVASMTYHRARLSAVAHNNSIYVFGGAQKIKKGEKCVNFVDFTDKVEQYNIATDSWSTIYALDTASINIIPCLCSEYVILVGGYDEKKKDSVKTIQVFDTDRLECTFMNSLEDFVSRGVAFSAQRGLVEKLKEHQAETNV